MSCAFQIVLIGPFVTYNEACRHWHGNYPFFFFFLGKKLFRKPFAALTSSLGHPLMYFLIEGKSMNKELSKQCLALYYCQRCAGAELSKMTTDENT